MKTKVEITLDTDSGDYNLRFWNLSRPGEPIEYGDVKEMLTRVLSDTSAQVESGHESTEEVYKEIH